MNEEIEKELENFKKSNHNVIEACTEMGVDELVKFVYKMAFQDGICYSMLRDCRKCSN